MLRLGTMAIVCGGLLMGCDTRPLNELTYAEQQEMLKTFTAACAEAGMTEKSAKYRTCIQTEINAENAKRTNQSAGMQRFGEGLSAAGANYSAAARRNTPMTCTTRPAIGWGSSTTTCY
jgi:hypothetical protein